MSSPPILPVGVLFVSRTFRFVDLFVGYVYRKTGREHDA